MMNHSWGLLEVYGCVDDVHFLLLATAIDASVGLHVWHGIPLAIYDPNGNFTLCRLVCHSAKAGESLQCTT
jgi:hypothetical protein